MALPNPPRRRAVHRASSAVALASALVGAAPAALAAQGLDDGMTVPRRQLRTTVEYAHEGWNRYWEGERLRSNDNVGTVTTRSVAWTSAYGVTDRLTLVATLPYVWTRASQGVLHGMEGRQDLTVAAKLRVLQAPVAGRATVSATALAGVGTPTSDYTPDFLPLSIGLGSRRAIVRGAVHAEDRAGWFADASAGHAWRSTVTLDRPAYYTDGRLVLSDEVAMPDVFDYAATAGFGRGRLRVPVTLAGQRTLGGGDIRRQDMPFVSNRMDFTRVHVRAMYALPVPVGLAVHAGAMRTLAGRNVGRASMLAAGITSAFRL